MFTKILNGSRVMDPSVVLFELDSFKYGYTSRFFEEIGVEIEETLNPEKEADSWYIEGVLHGFPVLATYNAFESMKMRVSNHSVSYKENLDATFNTFINLYRRTWNEHNKNRGATSQIL